MKYLKKYKLFESDDEDDDDDVDENDIVPSGFKYSWNDVEDILLHLTDMGFVIDKHEGFLKTNVKDRLRWIKIFYS